MATPHDPAHLARLTFRWRDEHWHLIAEPEPIVVVVSDRLSKGERYPTTQRAESAFWGLVTGALLAHSERLASAQWPGTELAVIRDHGDHVHLAEKTVRSGSAPICQAWTLTDAATGLTAFLRRLHLLAGEELSHHADP